jgi:hypothetical protein
MLLGGEECEGVRGRSGRDEHDYWALTEGCLQI